MRKIYFALLSVSVIILTGCNNPKASLEFEKEVMYEIYPALIDLVWVNAEITNVFIAPPSPEVKNVQEYNKRKRRKLRSDSMKHCRNTKTIIKVLI